MSNVDHLALAKEDLAIAESADAKREAYKRAAKHIVAHKKATGDTDAGIAIPLGVSREKVVKLRHWAKSGFKAETPFLMDGDATKRAAKSHAKSVLADPEQRQQLIDALPKKDLTAFATEAYEKLHEQREERDETERQRRRAVREENAEDPYLAHYELIRLQLAKIESTISDAVRYANDAGRGWPEQYTAKLIERIGRSREMLGILELAVSNSDEVDWDVELERLTTAEEA